MGGGGSGVFLFVKSRIDVMGVHSDDLQEGKPVCERKDGGQEAGEKH